MGSIYPGRVMRVDPGGPLVRVPLLGRDALWGPVMTIVGGLLTGEQVIVGQLGATRDQLVILGRLDPEGLANANARMVELEALVAESGVRLTAAETGIAQLARSDHRTGVELRVIRDRLGSIENAATALPAVIDATTGTAAAVTELQADVATLQTLLAATRTDLGTTQANVTSLEQDLADALARIGALEEWQGAGGGGEPPPTPPSSPGALLDLSRWELTLPVGSAGNPDDIYAPALNTYTHSSYFRIGSDSNGYYVEYAAPVNGSGIVTTSAESGASRSELREMGSANGGSSGPKAAWSLTDGQAHSLTVTITVDPTSIVNGRKEVIIGQIHGSSGTPPVYLAANFNSTPKITLFKNGPSLADILTSITSTTVFTYKLAKTSGNRVQLSYALGTASALPGTPQYDWPASDFSDASGNYFKCGVYNKTPIDDADASGVGRVRMYAMTLV